MIGLARPPDLRDAETATPPVLDTLAAAGYRIGRWLVKAGRAALEPHHESRFAVLCQKIKGVV